MSKLESNLRHSLIISKLRRSPATFEEINDYLKRESELRERNLSISIRTFQRDKKEIEELYSIVIEFDSSSNIYKIIEEEQDDVKSRMLESFEVFNALNLTDGISRFLHFEKRSPQGTNNLNGLLHAIQNFLQIKFVYLKFWGENPETRTVKPLALKEFRNRWYLLAQDTKDERIKTFALDKRFSDLEITRYKFEYPSGFNVEKQFKYSFGIIAANGEEPQDVILSFDPFQGKYIKSLPLHETQEVLVDNEKELRIKLKICLTFDFKMELLSHGEYLTVLQPDSLVEEIKESCRKLLMRYK